MGGVVYKLITQLFYLSLQAKLKFAKQFNPGLISDGETST